MGPPARQRPKEDIRKHTGMVEKEKLTVLKWPAMSPDLNPIEHLWGEHKSAISVNNPTNVQELEQLAKEEWEKITADKCKKLIDGFKKRLDAVIAAKGCATKY